MTLRKCPSWEGNHFCVLLSLAPVMFLVPPIFAISHERKACMPWDIGFSSPLKSFHVFPFPNSQNMLESLNVFVFLLPTQTSWIRISGLGPGGYFCRCSDSLILASLTNWHHTRPVRLSLDLSSAKQEESGKPTWTKRRIQSPGSERQGTSVCKIDFSQCQDFWFWALF